MNKLSTSQLKQLKEIGTYLYQKRLEGSMSLEQIAASTHIRLALLKALEEGQVDQLPELIYVQGFIRRYGQMLQVDGETLAKTLSPKSDEPQSDEPVAPEISPQTARTRPLQPRSTGLKKIYGLYALILLLGAVGGGFYLLLAISRPPTSKSVSQSQERSPAKVASTPSPSISPKTPNPTPLKTSTPPPSQTSNQAIPLSATVRLEDSSWLKVIVDGQTKFEGVLSKGTQKSWQAKKQLSIRAGNAGVVSLSINEKPPQLLGRLGEVKEVTLSAL